jgi:hypothetical protein
MSLFPLFKSARLVAREILLVLLFLICAPSALSQDRVSPPSLPYQQIGVQELFQILQSDNTRIDGRMLSASDLDWALNGSIMKGHM